MSKVGLGTLAVTAVVMLALATSALAKGGGGASCAQILAFGATPGLVGDTPVVTTSYTVNNGCVDERMSSVALDSRNDQNGFTGRSVNMLPYGVSTYTSSSTPVAGMTVTLTLTVYAPNGKVADTRTLSYTSPA